MIKYETVRKISLTDWDNLVIETYKKPYSFQQQDGCRYRGIYEFNVPSDYDGDNEEKNDSIPFDINGELMCVKFDVWLNTPIESINKNFDESENRGNLFWYRNFYPPIEMISNDLFKKGLIDKGSYFIKIDW